MKRRKALKIAGTSIIAILVVMQLFRPARNQHQGPFPQDISGVVALPDSAAALLKIACYDCHSSNTNYPWYANVQPVAWYLTHHVEEGKRELNFNDFASYPKRKQERKLKAIASQVKDDEMPLSSYTIIHKKARLSKGQKEVIISWATAAHDSLTKAE